MSQPPSNGISIGSAVFAKYISVTNTQTHRQTYRPRYVAFVAIDYIHAMHEMRLGSQSIKHNERRQPKANSLLHYILAIVK